MVDLYKCQSQSTTLKELMILRANAYFATEAKIQLLSEQVNEVVAEHAKVLSDVKKAFECISQECPGLITIDKASRCIRFVDKGSMVKIESRFDAKLDRMVFKITKEEVLW